MIEILAVCFAVGAVTGGARGAELIHWETDLKAAFGQAQASNRPLLLHFWTPECVPCKRLDQTVFSQPRVAGAVHALFIPVKINANQYPELAARYGIKSVPNDVIITSDDEELHRMLTPQDADQYVAQLSAVAFRAGSIQAEQQSDLGPTADRSDSRYADDRWAQSSRDDATTDRRFAANPQYAAARSYAPPGDVSVDSGNRQSDEPPREVINRFARSSQEPTPRREMSGVEDQERVAGSQLGNVSGRTAGAQAGTHQRQQVSTASPRAQHPPAERPMDMKVGAADTSLRRQRGSTAESASSNDPALGLDGYCPVSLLQKNSWIRGDARFGVIHRGHVYLFAGPEEKEKFFSDPDEYSPVLAGIDPVRLAETGEAVMGQRAHGVVYRKRVYLFSSESHLQQFWQEPERYASPIRQAMETGDVGRLFR
jgi:protein disulfide-isomerase